MRIDPLQIIDIPEVQKSLATVQGRKAFVDITGFKGFIMLYLSHKYTINLAPMHDVMIDTVETGRDFIGILGFRGCAKSTILEDYAMYCLVTGKSKYTMYVGSTDSKSSTAVKNIKSAIEDNDKLRQDYNIIINTTDPRSVLFEKWSERKIVIGDCCIEAKSRGAKVRGVKFKNSRVTMVIGDDLEDTDNTKNDAIRKKTREWFFTELVPAMASDELGENTKIVMIGNLVHKDCLLAHLDNKAVDNANIIKILKFPLLDSQGECNWKALYPTPESIEKQKQKVYLSGEGLGQVIWAREYLLKLVDESEQVIKETDISYYPDEWLLRNKLRGGVGVDLAISKSQTADYTVFVKAFEVYNDDGERRILISRSNLKGRFDFTETISKAKIIKQEMPSNTVFYVEDVAYQKSAIEIMQKNGINAKPMQVRSKDKRSRLISVSPYIKSGMVLFPKSGADDILKEMIGFGIEAHDDAMDACVHVIEGMLNRPTIVIAE